MSAVVKLLSASEAQRLTQRIKLTASGVRDGLFKLRNLVDEAKNTNVWNVLGFPSWPAYLADTLGSEPMRLGREERQELVGYLAGEGMSTRAIAPIVGVSREQVRIDVAGDKKLSPEPVRDDAPEYSDYPHADPATGEVIEAELVEDEDEPEPVKVIGLDGKTYTRPEPHAYRRPLPEVAKGIVRDMELLTQRIDKMFTDDRFRGHAMEIAKLFDDTTHRLYSELGRFGCPETWGEEQHALTDDELARAGVDLGHPLVELVAKPVAP